MFSFEQKIAEHNHINWNMNLCGFCLRLWIYKKHLGQSCMKCLSRNLSTPNIPCQINICPKLQNLADFFVMLFLDTVEISSFISRSWPTACHHDFILQYPFSSV